MEKIIINDISLIFDDMNIGEINRYINIIRNNYFLFSDYFGKTLLFSELPRFISNKNVVFINDFDSFFESVVDKKLKDNKIMDYVYSDDFFDNINDLFYLLEVNHLNVLLLKKNY